MQVLHWRSYAFTSRNNPATHPPVQNISESFFTFRKRLEGIMVSSFAIGNSLASRRHAFKPQDLGAAPSYTQQRNVTQMNGNTVVGNSAPPASPQTRFRAIGSRGCQTVASVWLRHCRWSSPTPDPAAASLRQLCASKQWRWLKIAQPRMKLRSPGEAALCSRETPAKQRLSTQRHRPRQ